jgi:hypothetical protein
MTKQRKAAALTFVLAIAFVALEVGFGFQTAFAGVFVAGMGGGLLIGEAMAKDAPSAKQAV